MKITFSETAPKLAKTSLPGNWFGVRPCYEQYFPHLRYSSISFSRCPWRNNFLKPFLAFNPICWSLGLSKWVVPSIFIQRHTVIDRNYPTIFTVFQNLIGSSHLCTQRRSPAYMACKKRVGKAFGKWIQDKDLRAAQNGKGFPETPKSNVFSYCKVMDHFF